MQPIGPLMIEHKLIMRAIGALDAEKSRMQLSGKINHVFIVQAVDFLRFYADKTHHGKEEDILFKALDKKPLSPEHRATLTDLLNDHTSGRKLVTGLAAYRDIDPGSADVRQAIALAGQICAFYPMHIQKEEKGIFLPGMQYFTTEEMDAMLEQFWEYDRQLIHTKYRTAVETLESQGSVPAPVPPRSILPA